MAVAQTITRKEWPLEDREDFTAGVSRFISVFRTTLAVQTSQTMRFPPNCIARGLTLDVSEICPFSAFCSSPVFLLSPFHQKRPSASPADSSPFPFCLPCFWCSFVFFYFHWRCFVLFCFAPFFLLFPCVAFLLNFHFFCGNRVLIFGTSGKCIFWVVHFWIRVAHFEPLRRPVLDA